VHWNGTSWTQFPTGHPATSALRGLWGSAANDVWAAGEFGHIIHWDGTAWSDSIDLGNGSIYGISGTSATDVWAAGTKLLHWDGSAWVMWPMPLAGFFDIWARTSTDVWAVGIDGAIAHFDGTQWCQVPADHSVAYVSIWGASAKDLWLVDTSGVLHGPD
jgi:hypothetical protein